MDIRFIILKDITSTLKDTTLSRLKNPVLGSFIFCWMIVNMKTCLLFLFNSNDDRLNLINSYAPSMFNDFLYPALLTVFYIFIFPFSLVIYDLFNEGVIKKLRNNIKQQNLKKFYQSNKTTNEAKVASDEDVIKQLIISNINEWPIKKDHISKQILDMKSLHSHRVNELSEIYDEDIKITDMQVRKLISEKDELNNEITSATMRHTNTAHEAISLSKSIIFELSSMQEKLDDTFTDVDSGTYERLVRGEKLPYSSFYYDLSEIIKKSTDSCETFNSFNRIYTMNKNPTPSSNTG